MVIDVSEYQGTIDWEKVKPQIEGAIIRCGYGDNLKKQDDKQFYRNVSECERLGIPYGIYLYSYADTVEHAISEAKHLLRCSEGCYTRYPLFLDLEETKIVDKWCEVYDTVKANLKGAELGIYSSAYYLKRTLKNYVGRVPIWCAQWGVKQPQIICDIWQYGTEHIDGIKSEVDSNILYTDYKTLNELTKPLTKPTQKKSEMEIAQEVIHTDKWGVGIDRFNKLKANGYNPYRIQHYVNKLLGVKLSNYDIAKQVLNDEWGIGIERKNHLIECGYDYYAIQVIVTRLSK